MESVVCLRCNASDVVKRGRRRNNSGTKQLYLCNGCGTAFVKPDGFERMRFHKEDIVRAVHMHEDGLSLSKVQNHLWQHDGVKVSRWAIAIWVRKYSVFLKSGERDGGAGHKRQNPHGREGHPRRQRERV